MAYAVKLDRGERAAGGDECLAAGPAEGVCRQYLGVLGRVAQRECDRPIRVGADGVYGRPVELSALA